ncbi:MAG: hypothetical protein ABIN79_01145 [Marmoricola sp.]
MDQKGGQPAGKSSHVYVASSRGRMVVRLGLVIALVAMAAGTVMIISSRTTESVVITIASVVLLVACWGALKATIPQRVTVQGPVIEIRRDGKLHRFDLEDPGVDILVKDGEIAFAQYKDGWISVRAKDVDWKVFSDVVMHYQNQADHNAEERDKRFNS